MKTCSLFVLDLRNLKMVLRSSTLANFMPFSTKLVFIDRICRNLKIGTLGIPGGLPRAHFIGLISCGKCYPSGSFGPILSKK